MSKRRSEPVAIWQRTPDDDIPCPVCTFEQGSGTAIAYLCLSHPQRSGLIGTHSYYCASHQREVPSVMIPGVPLWDAVLASRPLDNL